MAVAGSLTYDTKIDKSGFKKGLNGLEKETGSAGTKIKDIVAGLGITKIIGKAFSLISDNMDSAIKRIDTLNNFPKVMSNLGISSEDSTKAINKLSDGLKGIPTKLDDASLAVQRFTSINNDVNKSTDYFLAFNNALLAGGASADIQSNALEQLSQMYAVGTVDAQAWRSVQTAMPAQLQQVAQSMGYTSTAVGGDFYNAIQKGKISMEDFMQQIVKLNKEGTGQYASFAEQAKSATGGIQTAISNAKTAISRGVAELISKVNEGLQNAGIGSISDIISEKGKNIEKVLKAVAEQIPKIIEWVVKNKDSLISLAEVIATVIGAYKLYELTLLAIKGIQFVSSISGTIVAFAKLIPCIKSVKDAMILLNMVISVNPIALVVTAIGLLVAGFIYLWNTSEGFRNFWIGLWEKIKQGTSVAVENITKFFTETIPEAFNRMIEWLLQTAIKIEEWKRQIVEKAKNAFREFVDMATTTIRELPGRIWEWLSNAIDKVKKWGTDMARKGKEAAQELFNSIVEKVKEIPGEMLNVGKNIVEGLWNGIKNAKNWIKNKISEFANGIIAGFKDSLGIHSPSVRIRDEVAKYVPEGFAVGIKANTDSALKAIDNMNDEIVNEMSRAVAVETGSINAKASVKSNNSMINIIQATFNIDGSVDIDGKRAGRILTPYMSKTLKTGGVY